jgi:hypothetical protein
MSIEKNDEEWLYAEDQAKFSARLERLQFLGEQHGGPRDQLITGGLIGYLAFDEACWCFINGHFIACVVLTQMVLEHLLAGLFRIAGRDDIAGAGFGRLLWEAQAERFISTSEFEKFNLLRERRNPYSHSRKPLAPNSIERRMLQANAPYEEIMENDAREALQMLFGILQRKPFAL